MLAVDESRILMFFFTYSTDVIAAPVPCEPGTCPRALTRSALSRQLPLLPCRGGLRTPRCAKPCRMWSPGPCCVGDTHGTRTSWVLTWPICLFVLQGAPWAEAFKKDLEALAAYDAAVAANPASGPKVTVQA